MKEKLNTVRAAFVEIKGELDYDYTNWKDLVIIPHGYNSALALLDEVIAMLDSEELIENVAIALNQARILRPTPQELAQAAINTIKG